jgi:hypothetical protein
VLTVGIGEFKPAFTGSSLVQVLGSRKPPLLNTFSIFIVILSIRRWNSQLPPRHEKAGHRIALGLTIVACSMRPYCSGMLWPIGRLAVHARLIYLRSSNGVHSIVTTSAGVDHEVIDCLAIGLPRTGPIPPLNFPSLELGSCLNYGQTCKVEVNEKAA